MRVASIGTIGLIQYQRMLNIAADRARMSGELLETSKTPAEVLKDKYDSAVSVSISVEAKALHELSKLGE